MVRKSTSLIGLAGLTAPGMVFALGLGELSLQSYLNEPLRAEVLLLESEGLNPEQVKIRLAGREDFERAGIERQFFLTSLKFEVVLGPGDEGRLLISSAQPVREPFLDFVIEARWPNGRLLREYTLLLDPPVFTGTRARDATSGGAVAAQREPAAESAPSAPAPRSTRSYDADAADQPAAGSKYLVQRNETLWAIASLARPSGASVQQTMLDIQRLNPEAFIDNNVNRLKAGYVLRLPSADEISSNDFDEAVAAIKQQEESWQAAREGRRLDASEDAGSSGVVEEGESGGRLQIAGAEEDPTGYGQSEQELTASLENLDRAQRDNEDMRARMDAMEEQVATMQRLLELKDNQISSLQNAVREGGQPDEVTGTITPVEEETAPEAAPQQTPEAEPAPQPAPAPVVEERGLVGTLMDNLAYIGAGLVLIILLVVFALRRRGSGDEADSTDTLFGAVDSDDEFADVQLGDDGLIVDQFQEQEAAGEDLDTEPQGFATGEGNYAARFESGDALAEADIYIAYGRYPQAVDVLKSAIAIEPVNTELRLKLMEACAEMAEREEFQQQYADLQMIGDEQALSKARDYLEIVDGGEMWLEDLPNPSITMAEVDAARARMADGALRKGPEVEYISEEEEAPAADDGLNLDLGDAATAAAAAGAGAAALDLDDEVEEGEETVNLDFNLEVEEIESAGQEAGAANADSGLDEVGLDTPVEAGSEELSLDLDAAGDDSLGDLELEPQSESAASDLAASDLAASDLDDLGLDDVAADAGEALDLSAGGEPELELADELEGELLTEFGDLTIEGEEPAVAGQPDLDQSLGELTDSLSAGGAAAAEEGEAGDVVFAANGDEAATKLDLARAYMDMGDEEGARSILEEVVADGNDGQKQEAQSLLDSIA